MAKLTLADLASGHGQIDTINANNDLIEAAINDQVAFRDIPTGETAPMLDTLDANANRIINLPTPTAASEAATKAYIDALIAADTTTSIVTATESQTATADQTVFTLTGTSYTPGSNNLDVYVNGVHQDSSAYSETSTTVVTFGAGVSDGDSVFFKVNQRSTDADVILSSNVTYSPDGASAVDTTVETKLREIVSPADFGAVGDGATDDTSAVQAAITFAETTGKTVWISTNHGVSAQLEITAAVAIEFAPGGQLTALAGSFAPTYGATDITAAVYMLHVSAGEETRIVNPNLDGNAQAGGIWVESTNRVTILGGLIKDMGAQGTYLTSSSFCTVQNTAYTSCGIDPNGTDTGSGFTSCLRNDTGNHTVFKGIHCALSGGKGIVMSSCSYGVVSNCYSVDARKAYGVPYYATGATHCKFTGNIGLQNIDTGSTAGSAVMKISVNCAHVSVENNTFIVNEDQDLIIVQDNDYTLISGNTLVMLTETAGTKFAVKDFTDSAVGAEHLTITENKFYGPGGTQSRAVSLGAPFSPNTDHSDQSVTGNTFINWAIAISADIDGGTIRGNNYINCTRDKVTGASSGSGMIGDYPRNVRLKNSDTVTSGVTAGTEVGWTLPVNFFDRTSYVRVKAAGKKTGGNDNKEIKFRLGTNDVVVNAAANDTNDWMFEAWVMNTLAGGITITQRIHVLGYNGTTVIQDYSEANEDTDAALFIGALVVVDNAGDSITVSMMTVDLFDGNLV